MWRGDINWVLSAIEYKRRWDPFVLTPWFMNCIPFTLETNESSDLI